MHGAPVYRLAVHNPVLGAAVTLILWPSLARVDVRVGDSALVMKGVEDVLLYPGVEVMFRRRAPPASLFVGVGGRLGMTVEGATGTPTNPTDADDRSSENNGRHQRSFGPPGVPLSSPSPAQLRLDQRRMVGPRLCVVEQIEGEQAERRREHAQSPQVKSGAGTGAARTRRRRCTGASCGGGRRSLREEDRRRALAGRRGHRRKLCGRRGNYSAMFLQGTVSARLLSRAGAASLTGESPPCSPRLIRALKIARSGRPRLRDAGVWPLPT